MSDVPSAESAHLPSKVSIRSSIAAARERRTPSGFDFVIADRIEFLDRGHWESAAQSGGVFLSRDYLEALQKSGPEGMHHRYAIIFRETVPVAVVAAQCLTIDGTQLVKSADQLSDDDRAQLALKKLGRKALGNIKRRVLVCGNLFSWGTHGVGFAADEDPKALWPAVAEALYRIRRADRLHGQTDYVIVKDLFEDGAVTSQALERFSYRLIETEPDMVLDIPDGWSSFDDYLASLNKKYRKAARTILQTVDDAGANVSVVTSLDTESERLHELYRAVAARADVRLAEMSLGFLPVLAEALGPERFALIGVRLDEQLCGFVTVLRDGDHAVGYYLGIDYDVNDRLPLYHRLLYAVIEQAITWGCRRVSFGRTALEPKARLGCSPVPAYVWIRHRVPVLNFVVRQLLKGVSHEEPPERKPFKATS